MSKKKPEPNVVLRAIEKVGTQAELSRRLTRLSGHAYEQGHISYWKKTGRFPADLATIVANEIFAGDITPYEACPRIKRVV